MESKKNYEVPHLTVVTFQTERGYSASVTAEGVSLGNQGNVYTEGGNTEGDGWF